MVLGATRPPAAVSRRRFLQMAAGAGLLAAAGLCGCASSSAGRSTLADGDGSSGGAAAGAGVVSADVSADGEPVVRTLFAFDTVITLTVYGDEALADELAARCEYFEEHFSRTLEGTDVWRINNAGGQPVEVADETADILTQALGYCEASDGLFDVTIGAVSSLWDFKEGVRPSDEAVAEALHHVDWRGVQVDGNTVVLADPSAMIDLGGIAKGYIADDLVARIRAAGCQHAIVNLGGNVAVVGSKPDGSPWKVGIQDPNAPTAAGIVAVLETQDQSVVTSGLYERSFTEGGIRYHHILDPRTGFPVETDLVSSSVAGESGTQCDALATWLFLLGSSQALEHLESLPRMEALLITDEGDQLTTAGAAFVSC